ncbi:hypothetical protein dsx2_1002 [Desulfovibrio sp. X2]|uniref:hypothetical protein n=1 Tax=Desulfovibrio sp. X2 TaxID=941449 RepID=UPI000358870C|nr:hypothetical protein [Desulfovibrio sp. X2]EPR37059.1 hypothetical protein dsx2_1002 [Desulfovibrio sp. X2]
MDAASRRARLRGGLAGVLLVVGVFLWITVAWWLGLFHILMGLRRGLGPRLGPVAQRRLRYVEWIVAAVILVAVIVRWS